MRYFHVTVNGVSYDVAIEECNNAPATAQSVTTPATAQPVTAPAPAPTVAAKPQASVAAGAVQVKAPMPGNILKVNCKAGQSVKRGDVLIVLEAMKMENDICAPEDGVVSTVAVAQGATVATDDLLVALN